MGAVFLCNLAFEYSQADFRIDDHAYGSIFYLMTGFHGLHVLGGLVFMGAVAVRHRRPVAGADLRDGRGVRLLLALRRRRVGRHVRHRVPAAVRHLP